MDQKRARRTGKNDDLTYSGGFIVGNDGKVAQRAVGQRRVQRRHHGRVRRSSRINGRKFDGDALKDAIKAAAGNGPAPRAADPRR